MLPRAIWLGSRRPFAGAAASIAINSAFFYSQKNGLFRDFWSVPGRRTRCRALSTRYGSPRTALESSTQPRRRRVSRKMVGRLPMLATPRRDAAARAQMNKIPARRTSTIIDASSSCDNSRRQGRLIGSGARARQKIAPALMRHLLLACIAGAARGSRLAIDFGTDEAFSITVDGTPWLSTFNAHVCVAETYRLH